MSKRSKKSRRVLIVDDDQLFLDYLRETIAETYPGLTVSCHTDPLRGLREIDHDLDLLLLDLEMPGLDGCKLLQFATSRGLDKSRIIILSGRDAEHLHRVFPMGTCLAVLNKHEARQKEVLRMVLSSLQRKLQ